MLDLEVEGLGALQWRSSWGEPHLGGGLGLGESNWGPGSARLGRFHLLLSAAGTVVTCHRLLLSSTAVSCGGSHCRDATMALLLQRGSAELPPHFRPQKTPLSILPGVLSSSCHGLCVPPAFLLHPWGPWQGGWQSGTGKDVTDIAPGTRALE